MPPQSQRMNIILAATSAIIACASVAPAAAQDHPAPSKTAHHDPHNQKHQHGEHGDHRDHNGRHHQPGHNGHHHFKGRVIAHGGLNIREQPTTHSRIIGFNREGSIVTIRCKVNGERINGNPRWYKLADKTHGWSAARYITNIGPAPDWCHDQNAHGSDHRHKEHGQGHKQHGQGHNGHGQGHHEHGRHEHHGHN